MKRILGAIPAAALFAGCGGGGGGGSSGGNSGPTLGGTAKKSWSSLEKGQISNFGNKSDAYLVVRDEVTWSFLYHWVRGASYAPLSLPSVDFSKDVVVAAILSTRPNTGYDVTFTDVTWPGDDAVASVQITVPGPTAITQDLPTSPFEFIRCTAPAGVVYIDAGFALTTAEEVTYEELVEDDWLERKLYHEKHPLPYPQPPQSHFAALDQGRCPLDGTALVFAPLPADGTYTDLANEAYFCPADGKYWNYHTQGAFVGTISYWLGDFAPGIIP